jgi:8-oxo-dGTP pyrophosphatase MutT (NUDIX family)
VLKSALDTLRERLKDRPPRTLHGSSSRRAAVLVPLLGAPHDLDVLFFERTDEVIDHKGEICFPGGSLETDDDGPIDAALREAHEELALPRNSVEVLGLLDDVETVVSNFTITPVVGFVEGRPQLQLDPLEVARLILVPLARLLEPGVESTQWSEHGGVGKLRYVYTFDGNAVWGATGRILHSLVDVLRRQ